MQFPLGSTFSKHFVVALVILLAWAAMAQGAAISAERARTDMVDLAKDLSRRVNTPLAASKRDEGLAGRDSGLSRGVNVPVDDGWYRAIELSAPTERDLSRRQESDFADPWYTLAADIETKTLTEGDDPTRRVDSPVDDREMWYTLTAETEESE